MSLPLGLFVMRTYYQFFSSYKLSHSKPSLVGLSLYSPQEFFPFIVLSCIVPYLILDNEQHLLF